jgi:hypothetical protein
MTIPNSNYSNLDHVDQEIRIEKLKREIEAVTGSPFVGGTVPDCDPGLHEAFLEHVLALETQGYTKPFDELVNSGLMLPPPDQLDDTAVSVKLWELIRACAANRLFLHCTDHLSDRELYAWLWSDALREEMMGFGLPVGNTHLDVLGRCTDEDVELSLRYYSTDEQRARWAIDFPECPMPPRVKRPFDRDRHLPQPPGPPF